MGSTASGGSEANLFRAAHEAGPELEFVAVNDITDPATLAHLLKYDSILGRFQDEVEAREAQSRSDGREIKVLAERDPGGASVVRSRGRTW